MMPPPDPVAVGFRGVAARLTTYDLAAEAQARGYEVAALEAMLDVESSGSGYDAQGRPKILTEPHVFYRQLGPGPKRDAAVKAGIAYPVWGTKPYPPNSDGNYQRLAAMCAIDAAAAMQSTSWGIAQVMGFNFKTCGYQTVQEMVLAAMSSEHDQFDFMLRYIEHDGLGPDLRAHNWAKVAAGYNGPGAVAAYSAKLAAAYARHAGEAAPSPPRAAAPALRAAPETTDSLNDAEWLKIRGGQG